MSDDGNGTIQCCGCGGEGCYWIIEDGEEDEREYKCEECDGKGSFLCPGVRTHASGCA